MSRCIEIIAFTIHPDKLANFADIKFRMAASRQVVSNAKGD